MEKRASKILSLMAGLILLLSTVLAPIDPAYAVTDSFQHSTNLRESKIDNLVYQEFKDNEFVTFIVKLSDQIDVEKVAREARKTASLKSLTSHGTKHLVRSTLLTEMKSTAKNSQYNLVEYLDKGIEKGNVKEYWSFYIVNAVAVTATKDVLEEIVGFPEVDKILPNEKHQLNPVKISANQEVNVQSNESIEWNIERVGAPEAWEQGYDGTGTVVGIIDSGVEWDHPALKEKYFGYNTETGEVDHQYSFFDAYGVSEEAYDDHGHGTHVAGTILGSEPDGSNKIGVAPGAKWIAAKAFASDGFGSDVEIIAAMEWMLAPGGRVDFAPDVVNNSWSGGRGKVEIYRDIVKTWREYEIFPVFAAGNASLLDPGGPGSIAYPANYPESFAVGATDIANNLGSFSFQGPSPYGEIKPEVTAPGVNIRSSVPGGSYEGGWDGTSMATPHIAGAVAIMRQADTNISVDALEDIITKTATPLTNRQYPDSPNNGFGYGLINIPKALDEVVLGYGWITGQVKTSGDDSEPPTFEHTPITEVVEGATVTLTVTAKDNVSVETVQLKYKVNEGDWNTIAASLVDGNYRSGAYKAVIPMNITEEGILTYQWEITDFGNNTVTSDEYVVNVISSITVGYFQDFENEPSGWIVFGPANNWEWGVPTTGPGSAYSGEKVYATKLNDNYSTNMEEILVMPTVKIPEGESYLQFQHWHSFEYDSYSKIPYDYGYVVFSADMETWYIIHEVFGNSNGWEEVVIDLSDLAGQTISLGFYAYSDSLFTYPGWYIDDVALLDQLPEGVTKENITAQSVVSKNDKSIKLEFSSVTEVVTDEADGTSGLPLGATITVVETGRSTKSSPANGSFELRHPAGEYNVVAEAYGYETKSETVTVNHHEETIVHFHLEPLTLGTLSGKVIDESTGTAIEGASIYLMEDANIQPGKTDANGSFTMTAYEGTYTMRVIAPGYYTSEKTFTIVGNTVADEEITLTPISGLTNEIAYDDGSEEYRNAWYGPGNGWAVKMTLADGKDSAILSAAKLKFNHEWPNPGGTAFKLYIYDTSGPNGEPGNVIAGPFDGEAIRSETEWTYIDLSHEGIEVGKEFFVVYIQHLPQTESAGISVDRDGTFSGRSWRYLDGDWRQLNENEGNYMIRAIVNYDAEVPVLTAPSDGFVTSEEQVLLEGKVTPYTTVHIYNNGDEVAIVQSDSEGIFNETLTLSEGKNVFTAKANYDNLLTHPSNAITVIKDTTAPIITILSPEDGDKVNTKTIAVTGKVEDDSLVRVLVNGEETSFTTDGTFEHTITVSEGENKITITAFDLAGNESTESITVYVDFTAPIIENVLPNKDVYLVQGESVTIQFESEPGLIERYFMISISGIETETFAMEEVSPGSYVGTFTAPSDVVVEGANIEVFAVDEFGNLSSQMAEGRLFISAKDEEEPGDDKVPGDYEQPGDDEQPRDAEQPGDDDGVQLPSTAAYNGNLFILGFASVLFALFLALYRRKLYI